MSETNKENAYKKYFELVVIGLEKQSGERLVSFGRYGGQFFIYRGTDDFPYFLAASKELNMEDSGINSKDVIAFERIEEAATIQEIFDFLPDALAMSAICTAGKPHKFPGDNL